MKSLRRLISILLTVACFMLAVTGAYGIYRTKKVYRSDLEYLSILNDKIEKYRILDEIVRDGASEYRKAAAGLSVSQELFEERAAGHRSELVLYTATKSGIKQGEAQLAAAQGPLASGKAQLKEAEEQFIEGYEEFESYKKQIEDGKAEIAAGRTQINAAIEAAQNDIQACNEGLAEIAQKREEMGIGAPEEPSEEYQEALAAYNQIKYGCDTISAMTGYSPDNPESVAAADNMAAMAGFPDFASMLYQLSVLKAAVDALAPPAPPDDPFAEDENQLKSQLAQLNATVEYLQTKNTELDTAEAELLAAEQILLEKEPELLAGQEMLEEAKAKLAAGEAQLAAANQKIRDTKKELKETGDELSGEIAELAAEREELERRQAIVDIYEEHEAELGDRGFRLLNYDTIKLYRDEGMSVLGAADKFYAEASDEAESRNTDGIVSGIISLISFIIAAIGVAASFTDVIPRFLCWLPAADCFILALAAQKYRFTGIDNIMYSALVAAVVSSIAIITYIIPDRTGKGQWR